MNRGFTIIELIITIFILSIGIIGVFGAFSIMFILTSELSDRFTAAYLAQEGVEIIRNIRDSNWLDSDTAAWYQDLSDCGQGCEVDYTTGTDVLGATIISRWSEPGRDLNIKDGFYAYDTANISPTKFKRKISINPIENADGDVYILKVIVEVFWDQKPTILNPTGVRGSIKAEETLYDWY